MKGKGVFRISSAVAESENGVKENTLDFGIKLDDSDFEKLLHQMNDLLHKYKEKQAQPIADEPDYTSPLPSLDKQLDGKQKEELHSYQKELDKHL